MRLFFFDLPHYLNQLLMYVNTPIHCIIRREIIHTNSPLAMSKHRNWGLTDALSAHSSPTGVIKTSSKSIYWGLWKPLWMQTAMWHTSVDNCLLSVYLISVICTQGRLKQHRYKSYCFKVDVTYRKIITDLCDCGSPRDIWRLHKAKALDHRSVPNCHLYVKHRESLWAPHVHSSRWPSQPLSFSLLQYFLSLSSEDFDVSFF